MRAGREWKQNGEEGPEGAAFYQSSLLKEFRDFFQKSKEITISWSRIKIKV